MNVQRRSPAVIIAITSKNVSKPCVITQKTMHNELCCTKVTQILTTILTLRNTCNTCYITIYYDKLLSSGNIIINFLQICH